MFVTSAVVKKTLRPNSEGSQQRTVFPQYVQGGRRLVVTWPGFVSAAFCVLFSGSWNSDRFLSIAPKANTAEQTI